MKRKINLIVLVFILFVCYLIANCSNTFSIYRETLNSKVYLTVLNPASTYRITLKYNDGTLDGTYVDRDASEEVGILPDPPARSGHNFVGWYTDPNDGTKVTAHLPVTANVTYYAHWTSYVCKKAAANTLHQEECKSGASCTSLNHQAGTMIEYGNVPGNNSPLPGDAYDCDVNNDGTYDPVTERFYYIRNIVENEELSALVHYTSFDEDGQMDSANDRGTYDYNTAVAYLPDSTIWDNPKLTDFNGLPVRFVELEDLYATCGGTTPGTVTFTTCQYFLENTTFQSTNLGKPGIWMKKPSSGTNYLRYNATDLTVSGGSSSDLNAARPVIEIPFNTMEGYHERIQYTITYETNGGSHAHSAVRYENETLGTLPVTTKPYHRLVGWYIDPEYQTEANSSMVINSDTTVYAKWEEETDNLEYVFYIPGTCVFNGNAAITSSSNDCISTINTTSSQIDYTASTNKYIDTGISLYSEDNWYKDYEIGFTIDAYDGSLGGNQMTLMNTKLENQTLSYPGLVFRKSSNQSNHFQITEKIKGVEAQDTSLQFNNPVTTADDPIPVIIQRKDGIVSYSYNGGTMKQLQEITEEDFFNMTTWFGAASAAASATDYVSTAQRYLYGTLSNMYIKLEPDVVELKEVRFDARGGTASFASKEVARNTAVGELPTVNYPGYYFDGWYTAPTGGTKVTEGTIIRSDIDFYAQYKDLYLVTFHGEGGTVSINPNTIRVADGHSIGTSQLATITATQSGYSFEGWYTAPTGGTKIDGTETISADTDYYAHWKQTFTVTLEGEGGTVTPSNTIEVADGESIGSSVLSQYTATKTGEVFVGWYTAASGGTIITGNEIITANVTYHAQYQAACRVNFDGNGATPEFAFKDVGYGQTIGAFPAVERFNYIFDGWYIDDGTFSTAVTETTTVTATTNLIAKWIFADYAAAIGNVGYATIQEAIDAVEQNGTTVTTVLVLKDQLDQTTANSDTSFITVEKGRKVCLDLQGHTISTVATGNPKTVITKTSAELEIKNGTISTAATQATISDVAAGTVFKASNVTIINTANSKGQAIYNNGGTVYIEAGTVLSSVTASSGSNRRAALHNLNNGVVYINGGTITSQNYIAVHNASGTLTIGTQGGDVSTTTPLLQGKIYGVAAYSNYNFYDGIIKGETGSIAIAASSGTNPTLTADTNKTKIADYEAGTQFVDDIDGDYKTLYLSSD